MFFKSLLSILFGFYNMFFWITRLGRRLPVIFTPGGETPGGRPRSPRTRPRTRQCRGH